MFLLKVSSNFCSNTATNESVCLAHIFSLTTFCHEGSHITKLLLSECRFYDVLIDGCTDDEVGTDCLIKTYSVYDVVGCHTPRLDQFDHL